MLQLLGLIKKPSVVMRQRQRYEVLKLFIYELNTSKRNQINYKVTKNTSIKNKIIKK